MANVLVTGATGFIGPHLVKILLSAGHEVCCLRRKRSDVSRLTPLNVRFCEADVTQPETLPKAVAGVDVVYHLAGLTMTFRKRRFFHVNERGARNLVEACAARETPPVIVMVSSLAAGGPAVSGAPRVESDAPAPVSNYGRSKLAGERAAAALAAEAPITIVRPPIVFGEGDRAMLEMFRPISRFRVHVTPSFRDHRFSLIHAHDLSTALVLAAQRGARLEPPQAGECPGRGFYYVAFDEHPTYAELGRRIGLALGRRRTSVLRAPRLGMWAAAAGSDMLGRATRRPRIFNIDKVREASAGSWTCSAQAACDELQWSPAATLDERLRQTADWYREQRWVRG